MAFEYILGLEFLNMSGFKLIFFIFNIVTLVILHKSGLLYRQLSFYKIHRSKYNIDTIVLVY